MENKIWYSAAAEHFEEALALGNGTVGAMVYGKCDVEKVSLNVDSLWSGHVYGKETEDKYAVYAEAKKLFAAGHRREAEDLIDAKFGSNAVEAYLPAGTLNIEIGDKEISGYKRGLCLEKAVAYSKYNANGVAVETEAFTSAPDDVLVYRIKSSDKKTLVFSLDAKLKNTVSFDGDILVLSGQAYDNRIVATSGRQDLNYTYEKDNTIKYTIAMQVVTDGEVSFADGKVTATGATEATAYLAIKTSYVAWNKNPDKEHLSVAKETVKKASARGYDAVYKAHVSDFSSFYNRVKLDLGMPESEKTTLDRLLVENKDGDLGLCELIFNFGRYLAISGSRDGSFATNIQGIWNDLMNPPWACDYHTNINTQMNYWPIPVCNLPEFMNPLVDLLKMISESGKTVAKDYYNAEGFVAHHNHDIWGKATPSPCGPGNSQWMYWCMSGAWLCNQIFDFYEYTEDKTFLKETLLPIMKECAKFYMCILEKDGDKMVISPATSPENPFMYNGVEMNMGKYATMSQAIVLDLFDNVRKACDIVGEKAPDLYPSEMLNTYAIGSRGQLLEFDEEYEEIDIKHRHLSHLYGLYPGNSITTDDKVLADACRQTMEDRGDFSTGWAMGWRANIWAKLKDANRALAIIKNQLKFVPSVIPPNTPPMGGTYTNMFDAHTPFQIDGNFGVVAAVVQLFMQCENGIIKLFPALPDAFKTGSLEGLLAKGNVIVNLWWKDGKPSKITLKSAENKTVKVQVSDGDAIDVSLSANEVYELKV